MISTFDKPDLVTIVEGETGRQLKGRGKSLWMLCPLHEEKTPSFTVNPNRQTWHCFGCGEGGDVFTFIEKFKGLSFKDCIRYLGIKNDRPCITNRGAQLKRKLIKEFRQWELSFFNETASEYRLINKVKLTVKTEEDAAKLAKLYKLEPIIEYHLDILTFGDDEEKYELYKEQTRNGNENEF